ncbi:unnamed protein product [Rhizophagus irregularis]|nr:unnamed protein product [Rhizophagus irregularis]
MFIEKLRDGTHEKIPERQARSLTSDDDEKSPDPAEFVHKKAQSIGSNKKGKQSLYSTPVKKRGAIRNELASAVSNRSTFNTPITIASRVIHLL